MWGGSLQLDALSRGWRWAHGIKNYKQLLEWFAVHPVRGQLPRGRSRSGTRLLVPGTQETRASPPLGRCAGGGPAARSGDVAWRIPRGEEPGGYSPWGRRGGPDGATCTHASPREDPRAEDGEMLARWPGAPGFQAGPGRGSRVCAVFALPAHAPSGLSGRFWRSRWGGPYGKSTPPLLRVGYSASTTRWRPFSIFPRTDCEENPCR